MNAHTVADTLRFGAPLASARTAVLLLHGRGSSPDDIAGLSRIFDAVDVAFLAPAAENNTWYPQRFFVPLEKNEPWLSSALQVIDDLVQEAQAAGLEKSRIALVGFSQGACLALEYIARHPARYGLVGGLSGALIGPLGLPRTAGDLQGTPVLLGCAEADGHIPLEHVEFSARVLKEMKADVTRQIFAGSAHTIVPQEIAWLQKHFALLA